MVRGAFRSFAHSHEFREERGGTLMLDRFDYTSPLGWLGALADWLFLERYMRRFLVERAASLKATAFGPACSTLRRGGSSSSRSKARRATRSELRNAGAPHADRTSSSPCFFVLVTRTHRGSPPAGPTVWARNTCARARRGISGCRSLRRTRAPSSPRRASGPDSPTSRRLLPPHEIKEVTVQVLEYSHRAVGLL